ERLVLGRLEPVFHAAKHLSAAFPTSAYINNLCRVHERMPADEPYVPFKDNPASDIQFVRRTNVDTTMFVFCDGLHRAGLPLALLHRWLGRLPVSVVYLRDFQKLYYLAGIRSLGQSRDETLTSLRSMASGLGRRRI